jgi:hypothetical protein
VERIYGIVGDTLNELTDAIRRQGKIEWVHAQHEEREIRLKAGPPPIPDLYLEAEIGNSQQGFPSSRCGTSLSP